MHLGFEKKMQLPAWLSNLLKALLLLQQEKFENVW